MQLCNSLSTLGLPKSLDRCSTSRNSHTSPRNEHGIGKERDDRLMTLGNCGPGEMPKLREGTKMLRELDGSGRDIWQWE